MQGLRRMVDGEQILLFVTAFDGQPSTSLWENDIGEVHTIPQGEGGGQRDPFMSLLFCLGQHPELTAVSAQLETGEKLFAYLDYLYFVCRPERVGAAHSLLERHLQVWNRSGVFPPACVALQYAAKLVCPIAIVWRRDSRLPAHQQGFKVLVVPLGHPEFVQRLLEGKIAEHRVLVERIPEVPDTQSEWLLLSFCAAARANFFLGRVNPDNAEQFAADHDHGVWQCFSRILQISPSCGAQEQSSLPLLEGGLGLRSARRTQPQPTGQDTMLKAHAGFESPAWTELAKGHAPDPSEEEEAEASQLGDREDFSRRHTVAAVGGI